MCDQDKLAGGPFYDGISQTNVSRYPPSMTRKCADSSLSLQGGGNLGSAYAVAAERAVAAGTAAEQMGSPSPPNSTHVLISNASVAAALGGVKRSGPSDIEQPLNAGVAQQEKCDPPRTRARDGSSVGFSAQQVPQESGQEGAHGGIVQGGILREVDTAAGEKEAAPDPSGTSNARGQGTLDTEGLAPRLKLNLAWDSEGGPGLARTRGLSTSSPTAGGATSARTLGTGGSAAAGLTYPGPRPLSAPPLPTNKSAGNLNATSPILSGKRFEEMGVSRDRHLGKSRSLSRTAGASLAGRLMSYATRPGGTLDVFAAARDGQVGRACSTSISASIFAGGGGWPTWQMPTE